MTEAVVSPEVFSLGRGMDPTEVAQVMGRLDMLQTVPGIIIEQKQAPGLTVASHKDLRRRFDNSDGQFSSESVMRAVRSDCQVIPLLGGFLEPLPVQVLSLSLLSGSGRGLANGKYRVLLDVADEYGVLAIGRARFREHFGMSYRPTPMRISLGRVLVENADDIAGGQVFRTGLPEQITLAPVDTLTAGWVRLWPK